MRTSQNNTCLKSHPEPFGVTFHVKGSRLNRAYSLAYSVITPLGQSPDPWVRSCSYNIFFVSIDILLILVYTTYRCRTCSIGKRPFRHSPCISRSAFFYFLRLVGYGVLRSSMYSITLVFATRYSRPTFTPNISPERTRREASLVEMPRAPAKSVRLIASG